MNPYDPNLDASFRWHDNEGSCTFVLCHSCASRNPDSLSDTEGRVWIPAFAGMTTGDMIKKIPLNAGFFPSFQNINHGYGLIITLRSRSVPTDSVVMSGYSARSKWTIRRSNEDMGRRGDSR